jgi:putative DNA primase/helicase
VRAAIVTVALEYASAGWMIFPCAADKKPLIEDWPYRATRDAVQIESWWVRWQKALIGCPTGLANRFVDLDVDVKDPRKYGFDTLADLGFAILPNTPMVHTRSGGLHVYFERPTEGLRNTAGSRGRGIGPGLDWRGDGGYVILPSPGSGYWWDPALPQISSSSASRKVRIWPLAAAQFPRA